MCNRWWRQSGGAAQQFAQADLLPLRFSTAFCQQSCVIMYRILLARKRLSSSVILPIWPYQLSALWYLSQRSFFDLKSWNLYRYFAGTLMIHGEIFISYAWSGDSETIVNQLDQTFQDKGITIIRDKRDLGFKGRIKEFMREIGQGKCVIVVISEKYLRSENCMFELLQIAKNGEFYDRIFPIVLGDAKIYKPINRLQYVKYWEEQIKELDEAMKGVSAANLQGFREDIDLYTEIRNAISELTNILKDMNTLTPEMHQESNFDELIKAIEHKMAEPDNIKTDEVIGINSIIASQKSPQVDLLNAHLFCRKVDTKFVLNIQLELYLETFSDKPIHIPFRRCRASFEVIGSGGKIRLNEVDLGSGVNSQFVKSTNNSLTILQPTEFIMDAWDYFTEEDLVTIQVAKEIDVFVSIHPANHEEAIPVKVTLVQSETNTDEILRFAHTR